MTDKKKRKPKPSGYWKNWELMELECLLYIERHREENFSSAGLLENDRRDLYNACRSYGGMNAVRERLGLGIKTQRTEEYWKQWENLEKECLSYLDKHGPDKFKARLLDFNGGSALHRAIDRHHGGIVAVRARLGVESSRGRWVQWENVKAECLRFIDKHGPEKFTTGQLREKGCGSLLGGICRYHGGVNSVREKLGFDADRKDSGYWTQWENVKKECLEVIKESGPDKVYSH